MCVQYAPAHVLVLSLFILVLSLSICIPALMQCTSMRSQHYSRGTQVRDHKGNTALHAAAASGSHEAASYLLKASSDPWLRNERGHIPQDSATTPKFSLANELLVFALALSQRFRQRQIKPRLRRLLISTKPSLGFYPGNRCSI